MESYSEQEISDKLRFLKDVAKILIKDYENPIINVKWGEREDLSKYGKFIVNFIVDVKDD